MFALVLFPLRTVVDAEIGEKFLGVGPLEGFLSAGKPCVDVGGFEIALANRLPSVSFPGDMFAEERSDAMHIRIFRLYIQDTLLCRMKFFVHFVRVLHSLFPFCFHFMSDLFFPDYYCTEVFLRKEMLFLKSLCCF